jgi:hypothetical protein
MKRTHKITISCLSLALILLSAPQGQAQIPGLNQLEKLFPKEQKKPEPTPTPKPQNNAPAQNQNDLNTDKILALKTEITQSRQKNQVRIVSKEGTNREQVLAEIPAYLTFTNNYLEKEKDQIDFDGKDFIYARLKLPKKFTEYLPNPDTESNIEYFRVKVIANSGSKSTENNHKLEKKEFFKLAYNTNDLMIAIVPEKAFFESFLLDYKTNDNFISAKKAVEGYQNILARNFSRQISEMLKDLPSGINKVDITFEVTAKLRGADYKQINSAQGSFVINLDQEAVERYANTYTLLTDLYQDYQDKRSIAGQSVSEQAEKEMLKNMSPRDQERYNIAKRSPDGYMAAYKGAKGTCTFNLDSVRNKTAHIDIIWPDGGAGKEAGRHGFFITPNFRSKVKNIPIGATVTINGRVLIPKVTGNHTIPIYWYY